MEAEAVFFWCHFKQHNNTEEPYRIAEESRKL